VPGSTSNLGPGFDCVGVAIDRWLTVSAHLEGSRIDVRREGTLAGIDIPPEHDRLIAGFNAACDASRVTLPRGIAMRATSEIPVSRGLGSSAAALVAGAALANALLGLGLDDDALADACTLVEGHPDNVVASIRGGAVLALRTSETLMAGGPRVPRGGILAAPLTIHESLTLVLAVPDFMLSTAEARTALPPLLTHATATAAAARTAALVCGLATADARLLRTALDDLLHVPYRRTLIVGYDAVTVGAMNAGALGATLSGAGSSIVAVVPRELATDVARAMADAWGKLGVRCETLAGDGHTGGYRMVSPAPDGALPPAPPDNTRVRRPGHS
jgi:homoserine kinase